MKRSLALAAGVLAAASLAEGCSTNNEIPKLEVKPYQQLTGGKSLATVNGAEITDKELDERVNRAPFQSAAEVTLDKKNEFLDELIQNEVLYEEAKAKGYAEHPRVKLMMISLLEHDAMGSVAENEVVPDKDIERYFKTHHDQFVIPEKVRARRILVLFGPDKAATRSKAEDIRKEALANPNDFGKIAVERSEGPEKTRQGELGYFPNTGRPGLDAKIVSVSFGLKNGEVSPVFENDEGWNVVKVENRAPRTERPYDQVKKQIEHQILADKRKALLDNYVTELKNKAKIAVDAGAVGAYSPNIQPHPVFNPMLGMNGVQPLGGPIGPGSAVGGSAPLPPALLQQRGPVLSMPAASPAPTAVSGQSNAEKRP